jgi:hypothetical protein
MTPLLPVTLAAEYNSLQAEFFHLTQSNICACFRNGILTVPCSAKP